MSRTIEEILEVVQKVREGFRNEHGGRSVRSLRVQAVHSVAKRRGIDPTTVRDTYIRKLLPEIASTADFDRLLQNWLVAGSDELASVIRRHTSDPSDLARTDRLFTKASDPALPLGQEYGSHANSLSFREGGAQLKLHRTQERDPQLVLRAKEKWRREQGRQLPCFVCGFSFAQTYGNVGEDFIEAHHKRPISSLAPNTLVTLDDLVPVCSNCHSMLHRYQPWPTVEELRVVVARQRPSGVPP